MRTSLKSGTVMRKSGTVYYYAFLLFKTLYYVIYSRYIELNAEYLFISVIPNCQFRSKTSRLKTFTANQLDEIKDPSGLFYILPFQKV